MGLDGFVHGGMYKLLTIRPAFFLINWFTDFFQAGEWRRGKKIIIKFEKKRLFIILFDYSIFFTTECAVKSRTSHFPGI